MRRWSQTTCDYSIPQTANILELGYKHSTSGPLDAGGYSEVRLLRATALHIYHQQASKGPLEVVIHKEAHL